MLHDDDRSEFEATVARAIAKTDSSYRAKYRIVLSTGDQLQIEELGEITYDKTGEPLHLNGTIQDITERRLAEEKLEFTQFALAQRGRSRLLS